jgi:aminocarboxymuconate-semialdehyde decarboxylase
MPEGRIIDVHAHVTPQRFQQVVLAGDDWHGMTVADGELDNLPNRWLPERRIEEMDAIGVDVQVVSPTDVFYQYHQAPKTTARIARECNEEIAEMVRDHPDRFIGLGTLPMQDVERAKSEMTHAIRELGLGGFMIDDQVNGITYDHEVFDELWAGLEEVGAFILIHQFHPTVVYYRIKDYFLFNSVGNLVDRTLAFGALVYGGVMDSYPGLKICLAHAGGYVPYALDRIDQGWEVWPDSRGRSKDRPSSYVDRFYYDTVTFTDRNLRFMLDVLGSDRVVFGTDWPAPMQVYGAVERLRSTDALEDSERDDLLWRTAARIFATGEADAGPVAKEAGSGQA